MATTEWHGAELSARVQEACILAIDDTTSEAASEAEKDHWWINRTDQLEQEIRVEVARATRHQVIGRFGTTRRRGFYGLFLEYKHPFLRPIADRLYPTLPERIRSHLG